MTADSQGVQARRKKILKFGILARSLISLAALKVVHISTTIPANAVEELRQPRIYALYTKARFLIPI